MKKDSLLYIIKVTFFVVLAAFLLDKLTYLGLTELNSHVFTGQSGGKTNTFLSKKNNLDLIVFGSSRANHHIDPLVISKNSFNIGVDGSKIAFSGTLIKTLPKNKEQTVLLHISPKNSFEDSYKGEDITTLSKYYHQNETIRTEMVSLHQNSPIKNFFWCLNYNGSVLGLLKNYFFPKHSSEKYHGYDPLHTNKEQQQVFEKVLAKRKPNPCKKKLSLNIVYKKYITELKEFCEANNKRLILFTAPIYQDDCKNDDETLSQLLKKEKIEYWNFTDFFANDRSLENWRDNSHLSNIGAEKLTQEIKTLLNNDQN
ncbi:hypothetical protein [Maribacter thermophilus]|uniref:hypothetical protein n=1 Tax=Maribacter thermophilus TaxID=1197874 RepID=UPI00064114DC|nr:hypothetical protein [Maribacter thermophilus]